MLKCTLFSLLGMLLDTGLTCDSDDPITEVDSLVSLVANDSIFFELSVTMSMEDVGVI